MFDASNVNTDPAFKIGLCYFDPVDEIIYEVGKNSNYILGAEKESPTVHKLLIVTSYTDRITKLKLTLNRKSDIENSFDIKVQPGSVQPSVSSFDDIPSYNSLTINGPIEPNSIIPIYIYIEALTAVTKLSKLPIDIEYEYI